MVFRKNLPGVSQGFFALCSEGEDIGLELRYVNVLFRLFSGYHIPLLGTLPPHYVVICFPTGRFLGLSLQMTIMVQNS